MTNFNQARKVLKTLTLIRNSNVPVTISDILNYIHPEASDDIKKSKKRSVQRLADILTEEGYIIKTLKSRRYGAIYTPSNNL